MSGSVSLKKLGRLFAPASLRYQLLSRSLFILAALLLLIGIFQFVFMERFMYQNKAESIRVQIARLPLDRLMGAAGIPFERVPNGQGEPGVRPDNGRQGPVREIQPNQDQFFIPDSSLGFYNNSTGEYMALYTSENLGRAPRLPNEAYNEALQRQRKNPTPYRLVKDERNVEQLVVLEPFQYRGRVAGVVELGTPTQPLRQLLFRQLLIFMGLSLGSLLFGLLTFLPVMKRTLVPLSNMIQKVEKIDAGNLDERLPVRQGQAEIDRLADSFNGMLERLETSFEAEKEAKEHMRRFIADASHELRTPLTSIHGFLEVLLRGAAARPEQLHKALTSMYGESERMNKLVQDLLQLANLDRSPESRMTEGYLDDVLQEMEPQLRLLAGERKVEFHVAENSPALMDPDKMKQVILNLFNNAVQHTDPADGSITVTLEKENRYLGLTVRDNGNGIAEEHLPHIFERFYRVDSSRSRKLGGSGLGLSITKSIIGLHGGTIEAQSRAGEGTIFRIQLPALGSAPDQT